MDIDRITAGVGTGQLVVVSNHLVDLGIRRIHLACLGVSLVSCLGGYHIGVGLGNLVAKDTDQTAVVKLAGITQIVELKDAVHTVATVRTRLSCIVAADHIDRMLVVAGIVVAIRTVVEVGIANHIVAIDRIVGIGVVHIEAGRIVVEVVSRITE